MYFNILVIQIIFGVIIGASVQHQDTTIILASVMDYNATIFNVLESVKYQYTYQINNSVADLSYIK